MNVTTIGIDLAKTVFSIHGINQRILQLDEEILTYDREIEAMARQGRPVDGRQAGNGIPPKN